MINPSLTDRVSDFVHSFWGGRPANGKPQAQPAPAAAPANAPAPGDAARLSGQAEAPSPYAHLGAGAEQVRVDPWGKGPKSTLEGILLGQGYDHDEIYRRGEDGKRLLDHVADVNDLKDPNLVHPRQRLTVPVKPPAPPPEPPKPKPAPPQAEGETPPAPQPKPRPPAPRPKEMVGVTADAWGKGPDSSVEKILRNQGYSLQEIYRKDRQGRTLVDKVVEWNGMETPADLKAGQVLQVPRKPGERPAPPAPPREEQAAPAPAPPAPAPPREEPPPAPRQDEQPPAPPRNDPAPPAPEPAPAPAPAPPADEQATEGLTAEMGLMLDGAREGRFNRDEFKALNSVANRYEELRADYARDGYTPKELLTLGQHERAYGQMYANFYQHDRSDIEFVAEDPQDPRVQQRFQMTEEGGRIFDDFSTGRITTEEALERLRRQRLMARDLGKAG